MDSIGSVLRECRESKGYSTVQVGTDTHILPSYIEALENNRFQDLPGKIYCLGFIRNLARYYGIDADELAEAYKKETCVEKKRELEAPVSVGKIPYPGKNRKKLIAAAEVAALLLIGIIVFSLVLKLVSRPAPVVKKSAGTMYVMDEVFFERGFSVGDIVRMHLESGDFDILCKSIGSGVTLSTKSSNISLETGCDALLDLDGDGKNDVRIILKEIDEEAHTAVFQVDRALAAPVSPPLPTIQVAPAPDSTIMHDKGTVIVLNSPVKRTFVMDVEISGPCYLRYLVDSKDMVEKNYMNGEQLKLEVSDDVKLWISNAGMAKVLISSYEIILGNNGDVTSEKIGWEETADKNYNLSIVSMH